MFSIRIVNADFYVSDPLPVLDVCSSTLRDCPTKKVPVVRIYGSTPGGQKACMHVHQVFPYIYVPYDGTQPTDKYLRQFVTSVDFALQVALGRASSNTQHVYDISVVKGIPMYGYHEVEQEFLKISFYNPFMVTKVVDLLQNGAVMGKVFQPHEAHIPYILQLFMDYNLHGMNLLHASSVRFRTPVRLIGGEDASQSAGGLDSSAQATSPHTNSSSSSIRGSPVQIWSDGVIPSGLLLGSEVERQSVCELEVDIVASDIMNRLDIGVNLGANPGLTAIWEDERQRRLEANESTQIAPPQSQDRDHVPYLDAERRYKERVQEIIEERDDLVQSHIQKFGKDSSSPEEVANLEDSIHLLLASQKGLVTELSENPDVLSELLTQRDSGQPAEFVTSQVINEDEPIVDKSVVQELLEASQSLSSNLSTSMDKEMIDILASLADDDRPPSQRSHGSQGVMLDQGGTQSDEDCQQEEDQESDEEQSLVMSQRVWDDTDVPRGTGDEDGKTDSEFAQIRLSQFNLEGITDSWEGSMSECIPQVDGAGDEKSEDGSFADKPARTSRISLRTRRFTRLSSLEKRKDDDERCPDQAGDAARDPEDATVESGETAENMKSSVDEERGQEDVSDEEIFTSSSDSKRSWETDIKSSKDANFWPRTPKAVFTHSPKKETSNQGTTFSSDRKEPWVKGGNMDQRKEEVWSWKPKIRTYLLKDRLAYGAARTKQKSSPSSLDFSPSSKTYTNSVMAAVDKSKRRSGEDFALRLSSSSESDSEVNEKSSNFQTRKPKKQSKSPKRRRAEVVTSPKSSSKTKRTPLRRSRFKGNSRQATVVLSGEKADAPNNKPSREIGDLGQQQRRTFRVLSIRTRRRAPCYSKLTELKVELTDAHFIKELRERLHKAKSRLSKGKQNALSCLMDASRRKTQSVTKSPSPKKTRVSPSSSKYSSPKKKTPPGKLKSPRKNEDKRYATLPVLFKKSPKKSPVGLRSVESGAGDGAKVAQDKINATAKSAESSSGKSVVVLADNGEKSPVIFGVTEFFYSSRSFRGLEREVLSPGASTSKSRGRAAVAPTQKSGSVKRKLYCDAEPGIRISDYPSWGQKKRRMSLRLRSSTSSEEGDARCSSTSAQFLPTKAVTIDRLNDQEDLEVRSAFAPQSGEQITKEEKKGTVVADAASDIGESNSKKPQNIVPTEVRGIDAGDDGITRDDVITRHDAGNDVTRCDEIITCVPSSPMSCDENDVSKPLDFGASVESAHERLSKASDALETLPEEGHLKMDVDVLDGLDISQADEWNPDLFANALFNMSRMSPGVAAESNQGSPPQASSPSEQDIEDLFKISAKGNLNGRVTPVVGKDVENSTTSQNDRVQPRHVEVFSEERKIDEDLVVSENLQAKRIRTVPAAEDDSLIRPSLQLGDRLDRCLSASKHSERKQELSIQEDEDMRKHEETGKTERCLTFKKDDGVVAVRRESLMQEEFSPHSNERIAELDTTCVQTLHPSAVATRISTTVARDGKNDESGRLEARASSTTSVFEAEPPTEDSAELLRNSVEKESVDGLALRETKELTEQHQSHPISFECHPGAQQTFTEANTDDASPEAPCHLNIDGGVPSQAPVLQTADPADDDVICSPLRRPPSATEVMATLKDYGLPQCKYQKPFCSDPSDIPQCPREVGGRFLKIESKQVKDLEDFDTYSSFQGLRHWRLIMSTTKENSFLRHCQQNIAGTGDILSNVEGNSELKLALMGDNPTVITPCRGPPSPSSVRDWSLKKLATRRAKLLQARAGNPKANTKQVTDVAEKSADIEPGKTTPAKKDEENTIASALQVSEGEVRSEDLHEPEAIALSDSSGSAEVTSPDNLFSPVQGTFTFALTRHKDTSTGEGPAISQRLPEEKAEASAREWVQGGNLRFEPRASYFSSPNSTASSKTLFECKDKGSHPGSMNYETSLSNERIKSPGGAPQQSATESPKQLTSLVGSPERILPLSGQLSLAALHHSTPVSSGQTFGGFQSPRCTPIEVSAVKSSKPVFTQKDCRQVELGTSVPRPLTSSDQSASLRRQLLATQLKFVTPNALPRPPVGSQIEGPSLNNTYGFKVSQLNLQNSKSLHEKQYLTLLSVEVHTRSRRDLRPDPEFDPICAIFYHLQTDTTNSSDKTKLTGILCVDSESAKLSATSTSFEKSDLCNDKFAHDTTAGFVTGDSSRAMSSMSERACIPSSNTSRRNTSRVPLEKESSTSAVSQINGEENSNLCRRRPLLFRSGITDKEVRYVAEEKDLFAALIQVVRKWDPDILIGYELQMLSWGYLIQRALTFDIDLCSQLSRVKGSANQCNFDANKDRWGAAYSSEIKIPGRIILNVWRLLRHEVTLNVYSFENVAFHVLHERVPLFTFRTLSDWWDQKTGRNRWRTVEHYITRCRGNIRLLEQLDFIGRTSELARLFGILFYSVISRGSQYRVESMMLRIAKPMSYIAVSPSVKQRASMKAPETIPLVMEPESRFYTDPVLVLDFQSLYPSVIIAYNYCFSTCLGRVSDLAEYGDFKFGATSLNVPPSLLKRLANDIHISPNGVAFVKSHIRRGVLPRMLEEILQTRIMVKNSMKRWKADKSLGRMLDARQLGLKLIANVTFGYTSAHYSGRMPCVEIGDTIVRKARETLERAIELVNNTAKWGARVVYGDTDSLFVLLKGATKERAFQIGREIVDAVTAVNPKPVKLKFEKVYLPCVLQTKKRYVGYMYESLDQTEPVFDAKGIETVRRDSCPAVAKVLEKSLKILFESRDLSLVKKFVQRQCTKLMEGRVSLQDFTFAKEYRGMSSYKPGACVPALALTRQMLKEDRRAEPRVGERVPYVVVYGSPGLPLIQLVKRPHEVLTDPSLRLNASYYVTKQILPPLDRVFSLIGVDVRTWYSELPRIVRVAQKQPQHQNSRKGTISQYFSVMNCPVCQELTPEDLCAECQSNSQRSAVILNERIRVWERTHSHLSEICYQCCRSRDTRLCCVSFDCPVFHKLAHNTRDLCASRNIRNILQNL